MDCCGAQCGNSNKKCEAHESSAVLLIQISNLIGLIQNH